MAINDRFNRNASETYEMRKERLNKQATLIEQSLNNPRPPAPQLKPKGEVRRLGDAYARDRLKERRADIKKELAEIKKEQAKKYQPKIDKSKSL